VLLAIYVEYSTGGLTYLKVRQATITSTYAYLGSITGAYIIWGHVKYCRVWLNLYLIYQSMAGHQRTVDTPAGGGRADTPAGGGQADTGRGALYYGWAYMLTLWGKGGYGGSPNV
jgi:hypothetical protein